GKLMACFVVPDYEERRSAVLRAIGEIEAANGFKVAVDDELIESVTNLTEFPVPAIGRFDEKFLVLPKDVLITSMKTHQKFFSVSAPDRRIQPFFVVVTNSPQGDIAEIVRGNERVLNARLNDAMFFYNEDTSKPLESYVERLSGRIFLTGLGTMRDKAGRLMRLAPEICGILDCGADPETVKRAAMLAKADLATAMVGEFPELQGTIGMEYALKSGEEPAVAVAVFEHYLPRFAGDGVPRTNAGKVLSIAEKIDTIAGCFAVNLIPSGSEDPYALRRSAGGILKIMLDGGYEASLENLLRPALRIYRDAVQTGDEAALICRVEEFFYSRLESILTADHGIPTEFALAVLGARFEGHYGEMKAIHSPKSILDRAASLLYFYRNPATAEKFEPLMVTYRRVLNIMKGQETRDFTPSLFRQTEEA
ncbi:MAG: glycine--tRNA ligase subunit beta, partial [Deltaproteobacteria bacterium]|nr:glycine--tRNA ligase subunit beta [Deltaproteobacteria bacterium]